MRTIECSCLRTKCLMEAEQTTSLCSLPPPVCQSFRSRAGAGEFSLACTWRSSFPKLLPFSPFPWPCSVCSVHISASADVLSCHPCTGREAMLALSTLHLTQNCTSGRCGCGFTWSHADFSKARGFRASLPLKSCGIVQTLLVPQLGAEEVRPARGRKRNQGLCFHFVKF